ncbi:MAG: quinolinate synthase NadA [Candidatus Omnitrophica bacterium]|nr:quinolinate synthase NadA [Candidatus Omnitrophota bacterium]
MNNITAEIKDWQKKRNAIILAHNYQPAEIQELGDFRGDSLDLSRKASEAEAEVIVFCGVRFMAETAKILSPQKTVLLPDIEAGCPLADMVTAEDIRNRRKEYPEATVVTYINSSLEVKAESDYICTSSNALQLVQKIPAETILFFPDQNLGDFIREKTTKKMILWPGYCPTHMVFLPTELAALKKKYPQAILMVHPECRREIRNLADLVLSTGGMVKWVKENNPGEVIVGTEIGMIHRLQRENPKITYIPGSTRASCPNMKKITPEKILWSLKEMKPAITVPAQIAGRAKLALERMLQY